MKHVLLGTAALTFLTAPAFAGADDGAKKGPAHHFFERMDTNDDGNISTIEAEGVAKERFLKMDANNDGILTKDELVSSWEEKRAQRATKMQERLEKKFSESDADGDGGISIDEFVANASDHLKEFDADGDGTVTAAEMETRHKAMKAKMKNKRAAEDAAEVDVETDVEVNAAPESEISE
jgi:Ca2+-binding EF-hand superfamily protein